MKMLSEEKLKELLTKAWAAGFAHAAEQTLRAMNGKKAPAKATAEVERFVNEIMEKV